MSNYFVCLNLIIHLQTFRPHVLHTYNICTQKKACRQYLRRWIKRFKHENLLSHIKYIFELFEYWLTLYAVLYAIEFDWGRGLLNKFKVKYNHKPKLEQQILNKNVYKALHGYVYFKIFNYKIHINTLGPIHV